MIIYASCWHYEGFVLRLSSLYAPNNKRGSAKQVTVTSVTMWPVFYMQNWNYFTNRKNRMKEQTLDSPNWEFTVTKLLVCLLQSPVFLSSKPRLCNYLYIRQIQKHRVETSYYEFCWQKNVVKNIKNQALLDPDKCDANWKSIRPPLAFENACVYRGSSTGGLVWRPPFDLP